LEFKRIRRDLQQGFTLIEILVVLIIVGIISTFAISSFNNSIFHRNGNDLNTFNKFINYYVDHTLISGDTVYLEFQNQNVIAKIDGQKTKTYSLNNLNFETHTLNDQIIINQNSLYNTIRLNFVYNNEIYKGIINLNGIDYEKKK
jgi:prepilin-type N-terminal cleavage/methylation domain-containing protein